MGDIILRYPVDYVTITRPYNSENHWGMDLGYGASTGPDLPIYAAAAGIVVSTVDGRGHDPNGGEDDPKIVRRPIDGRDQLYRCQLPHTSQAGWEPENYRAGWAAINYSSAGTADDPIPAVRGMEYTYGLYYLDEEDGNTYLCERTGETEGGTVILQYLPHELVGQYFEVVTA